MACYLYHSNETLPINELKRITTFGGCADLNLHRCKEDNGFELTEDFDGIIKNLPNMNEYYFNLKMVCDSGGAQTRTMREVYHFIYNMLEYLLKYNIKNQYFINILDGDCSYKYMRKFNYLLNKPEYSEIKKNVFIGDMYDFQIFWSSNLSL